MPELLRGWLDALLLLLSGSNATLLATGMVAMLAAGGIAAKHRGNILNTLVVWIVAAVALVPVAYVVVNYVRSQVAVGAWSVLLIIGCIIVLSLFSVRSTEKVK